MYYNSIMNDDNNKITEHIQSLCFDVPSNVQSVITHNITKRLELGRSRYGHGVIINSDVSQWTENKTNNWIEMASMTVLFIFLLPIFEKNKIVIIMKYIKLYEQ